ncbi:MAG: MoaD/ThiS family protein [Candidatus Nanohaloarchaea archaeon]
MRDDLEEQTEKELEVEEGTEVEEFLKSRDIQPEEVLVSRNGTIISGRHELEEGDTVKVFDVIAGG